MKSLKFIAAIMAPVLLLTACGTKPADVPADAVAITLNDEAIQVDGAPIGADSQSAVYAGNDIVYYESGKDFTYGEGTDADAHSAQEAAAHTVVHITRPGTYAISGKLSKGQIAVDLGEDAEDDPTAVVTLILNGVDITCQVAPAVIFYRVYECGSTENPSKNVDTSAAGANVVIADGSVNRVNGAYVARIYKPDSVVLNEQGTEVADAKKLHKYDAAFYSKMSMNVTGGKKDSGVLNIYAENEGLDSELHLTLNGGQINIFSGNDGINTNEDGVSVTTINGGILNIQVTGETGEGDGIDSNGWLVINGGTVIASACSDSADAGIDSDMGIHINGGTVIAAGHMLDRIEDGGQTYAVLTFAQKQSSAERIALKNADGKALLEHSFANAYSVLVFSSPDLKEDSYSLWRGDTQLAGQSGGMTGGPGMPPGNMTPPDGFEGQQPPEGNDNQRPPERPDGQMPPDNGNPPQKPDGGQRPGGNGNVPDSGEASTEFKIIRGGNMFGNIAPAA